MTLILEIISALNDVKWNLLFGGPLTSLYLNTECPRLNGFFDMLIKPSIFTHYQNQLLLPYCKLFLGWISLHFINIFGCFMGFNLFYQVAHFPLLFLGGRKKRRRREEKEKRRKREIMPKKRCPKVNKLTNDPKMNNTCISIKTTAICNRIVQKF